MPGVLVVVVVLIVVLIVVVLDSDEEDVESVTVVDSDTVLELVVESVTKVDSVTVAIGNKRNRVDLFKL